MSHFNQVIDEVTFKAACKQNTAAQKQVYEMFSTPVFNLIYRITQNQTDALDITHDVFVKVLTKITQNKSPELLGFWIRRIAINATLTNIKNNKKLITTINFKEKTINDNQTETLSSIEFALSKLPALSRSVLWMYEVEGMSHQEIADVYGKSLSFSKTQLSRAKAMALSHLTTKGGGYDNIKKHNE